MVVNSDTPNLDIAREFLTALDEEAEFFTFQTFDDSKKKRPELIRTWSADLDDITKELEELSNKGAGIFVTINETDGKGRKKKNITRIRAVFADFDKGVPPLDTAPLEPHIVVESSPGKQHWYWLVDDLPLEEFEAVQKSIIQLLDSDDSVHDLSRVMRLPGFLHKKDPDNPHQVKLLERETYQPYKAEQIREAFPPVEDRPATKLTVVPGTASGGVSDAQAERILKLALGAVAAASEGERNTTLNREAFGLFGLVKAGRLERTEVETRLRQVAGSVGLSQSEIEDTLKSAWDSSEARLLDVKVAGIEWRQPPESGTEIRHAPPEDDDRPRWACYLNPNPEAGIRRAGVWYHGLKQGKKDEPPQPLDEWLCSPLLVEAVTRTPEGSDYGRLLRYRVEGRWRTWNMPMQLLGGDPAELRRELLRAGVEMSHRNPRRLFDYLTSLTPRRCVNAALEVGWHGKAFVLPDCVFGEADIHFQSESALVADYAAVGTLNTWQKRIARPAIGNKPLTFAISAALAGPLLHPVHNQGAGFHFTGPSSCGKTTSLQAAASVWGPPPLVRNWRATANGLEAAAAEANDLCLVLDEIGECTPKDVGRVVYALGNGTGKSRATQKGYARRVRRWRTVLLSSGERTLDSILREAGERVTAGQEMRLLSLPADGFAHGAFDELHDHDSGAHIANAIKTATSEAYGTAGRAWLTWLAEHLAKPWGDTLRKMADALEPENGQEARAAQAFALVAMAGEKGIEADILPWEKGEAVTAVREMWNRWREQRGQGSAELRQVVDSLAGFIARYEDRFETLDAKIHGRTIHDRAGYIKDGVFHFIPAVFKEAIGGVDANIAKRLLFEAGYLVAGDGKHMVRNLWVGRRTQRVVAVRDNILADETGGKGGKSGNVT